MMFDINIDLNVTYILVVHAILHTPRLLCCVIACVFSHLEVMRCKHSLWLSACN